MKKIALFLVALVFIFAFFVGNANNVNAQTISNPAGCLPGYLYSPITGEPCNTTPVDGCLPGYKFSPLTGEPCVFSNTVVISGVSGPQSLAVNQKGTWKVSAYDKNGGDLSYSVKWGDEYYRMGASGAIAAQDQQSATFTHTYTNGGTYYPTFYVSNNYGTESTSLSVKVGNATTIQPSITFISTDITVSDDRDYARGEFKFKVDSPSANVYIHRANPQRSLQVIFSGDYDVGNPRSAVLTATSGSTNGDIADYYLIKKGESRAFALAFVIEPTRGTGLYGARGTSLYYSSGSIKEAAVNFNKDFITQYLYLIGNATSSTITVLSPNGGEEWEKGTTQKIKWQDKNDISSHEIKLISYFSPPQPCTTKYCPMPTSVISEYTIANTQGSSYNWPVGKTLDGNVVPDGLYKMRICQTGTSICDISDSYFKITSGTISGSPQIKSITGNQSNYSAGSEIELLIKTTDGLDNPASSSSGYNIQAYIFPASDTTFSGNYLTPNPSYSYNGIYDNSSGYWKVKMNSPSSSGSYNLRVVLYCSRPNLCNNTEESVKILPFTVGFSSQTIKVLSPNGGETWKKGTTQYIKWRDSSSLYCETGKSCSFPNYNITLYSNYPENDATHEYPANAAYEIAHAVQGTSYGWYISPQLEVIINGPYYKIQVCQFSSGGACDFSDSPFTIVSEAVNMPTVAITADQTNVISGQSTVIRWVSANATSCVASGGVNGWAGNKALSGDFNTGSLNTNAAFYLTCSNSIGSSTASATVRVATPQPLTLNVSRHSASPSGNINSGNQVELFRFVLNPKGQNAVIRKFNLEPVGPGIKYVSNIKAVLDGQTIGTLSGLKNTSSWYYTGDVSTDWEIEDGTTATVSILGDVSNQSSANNAWMWINLTGVTTDPSVSVSGLPVYGNQVNISATTTTSYNKTLNTFMPAAAVCALGDLFSVKTGKPCN